MEKELLKDIKKRMDALLALTLERRAYEIQDFTLGSKIKPLYDAGLEPKEIADIVGKSNKHISKELSLMRKPRKAKHNKK